MIPGIAHKKRFVSGNRTPYKESPKKVLGTESIKKNYDRMAKYGLQSVSSQYDALNDPNRNLNTEHHYLG